MRTNCTMKTVSIILPATDETYSLTETVSQATSLLPQYQLEFLVVTSPALTTLECRNTIEILKKNFGDHIISFDQTKKGIGRAVWF